MKDSIIFEDCTELPDGDWLHTFTYTGDSYKILKKCALLQYKQGLITKEDVARFGVTKDCRITANKIAACLGKALMEYAANESKRSN